MPWPLPTEAWSAGGIGLDPRPTFARHRRNDRARPDARANRSRARGVAAIAANAAIVLIPLFFSSIPLNNDDDHHHHYQHHHDAQETELSREQGGRRERPERAVGPPSSTMPTTAHQWRGRLQPRHGIVGLCFLATFTAYVERVGFSIAFTSLARQVGFDEQVKGAVMSAFYWGYGVSQVRDNRTMKMGRARPRETHWRGSLLCKKGRRRRRRRAAPDADADAAAHATTPTQPTNNHPQPKQQIPGGWAAQLYGGRKTLLGSFLAWSLLSLLTPMGSKGSSGGASILRPPHPWLVASARAGVGVAQGFLIPAVHTVLSQWVPPHERARAVSLSTSGMYLGSAAAMLALPGVVARAGPGASVSLVGFLGLAWAALWFVVGREVPHREAIIPLSTTTVSGGGGSVVVASASPSGGGGGKEGAAAATNGGDDPPSDASTTTSISKGRPSATPWRRMLASPAVLAIVCNNFAFHYAFYVVLNWLPTFFSAVLGRDLAALGPLPKALPYLAMFACSNAGGWAGDWLIAPPRSWRVADARKAVNAAGMLSASLALLLMPALAQGGGKGAGGGGGGGGSASSTAITSVAFDHSGSYLAVAGGPGGVKVYQTGKSEWRELGAWPASAVAKKSAAAVAWAADAKALLVAGSDHNLRVLEAPAKE